MDNLLQNIGEEGLKSFPLAVGVWIAALCFFIFVAWKWWESEDTDSGKNVAGGVSAVAIIVWLIFGQQVWSETQTFCEALRGTDEWSEQKCNAMIDPGGSSFRSSTTP